MCNYDKTEKSIYIENLDFSNQYGGVLSQLLPYLNMLKIY